jgi:hypothetical protein
MTGMHPPHHAGLLPATPSLGAQGQSIDDMDDRVVSPDHRTEVARNRLDDGKGFYDETFGVREKSLSDRAA